MPNYIVSAHGTATVSQSYEVQASSEDEACAKIKDGHGEFIHEDIDVQSLSYSAQLDKRPTEGSS